MELEHPARRALADYHAQAEPGRRLNGLFLAYELLLRVDAFLLSTEFLALQNCHDNMVRKLLLFPRFHLGEWFALLQALVSIVTVSAYGDIRGWFLGLNRGQSSPPLQALLRWRKLRIRAMVLRLMSR
jgi:hypothetical protein